MIIPDVNVLLYATMTGFSQHNAAATWWEAALNDTTRVGIAPVVAFGFLRIATNPRVFANPLTVDAGTLHLDAWLERSMVELLPTGRRHFALACELLARVGTAANLTTDAQIAAHAIESGGTVYTSDPDFARFPEVPWIDPVRAG